MAEIHYVTNTSCW